MIHRPTDDPRPTTHDPAGPPDLRWHQALAWALTGEADPRLGVQAAPDLSALAAALDDGEAGRGERLRKQIAARRSTGAGWPFPVPPELMAGLGAAQFAAALADLRAHLDLDRTRQPVLNSRPLDADERRLLSDVPPHHGT